MTRRRAEELGNAAAGCMVLIAGFVLLAMLLGSCLGAMSDDDWCDDVEAFWADGNQHDSGLDDEYAFQCR